MKEERAAREVEVSPIALHLALFIPFALLVVLSWFTVVAPELSTERPDAQGRARSGATGEAAGPGRSSDRAAR